MQTIKHTNIVQKTQNGDSWNTKTYVQNYVPFLNTEPVKH